MRVFVEMPEDSMSYRCFAFFNTVTDTFDTWMGGQHWQSFQELEEVVRDQLLEGSPTDLAVGRYRRLTPRSYGGTAP